MAALYAKAWESRKLAEMTKKEKPVRIVPTIFAGWGAHLLLPRDRVLAVRCISSRGYRIRRLADLLGESAEEAAKRRDEADNEQRIYFQGLRQEGHPAGRVRSGRQL
jgi:hypothetical protein